MRGDGGGGRGAGPSACRPLAALPAGRARHRRARSAPEGLLDPRVFDVMARLPRGRATEGRGPPCRSLVHVALVKLGSGELEGGKSAVPAEPLRNDSQSAVGRCLRARRFPGLVTNDGCDGQQLRRPVEGHPGRPGLVRARLRQSVFRVFRRPQSAPAVPGRRSPEEVRGGGRAPPPQVLLRHVEVELLHGVEVNCRAVDAGGVHRRGGGRERA